MKSVKIGWREKKYRDRNTEMKTKKIRARQNIHRMWRTMKSPVSWEAALSSRAWANCTFKCLANPLVLVSLTINPSKLEDPKQRSDNYLLFIAHGRLGSVREEWAPPSDESTGWIKTGRGVRDLNSTTQQKYVNQELNPRWHSLQAMHYTFAIWCYYF